MNKEKKFYKALQDIFIGAKIDGRSGFVNLMKIKSNYYSKIEKQLQKDIEIKIKNHPNFKEELFNKLYSFFSRYFTESGSVYFNSTPFHNNIYEKVYTDEKDVILFWKTQMLYYVKTDRIFKSLPVEFDGLKFYFDASGVEHKKANEKRALVYDFKSVSKDIINLKVIYSERRRKTKIDEILKEIRKKSVLITEEQLKRAFSVFQKQSQVDYFINKNAKEFLKEQFKLWLYQYTFEGDDVWTKERIEQLQILKDTASNIIEFIAQFEDELVKIWNKPKFVKNSNYVVTLDKLSKEIINKIKKHNNYNNQLKEWQALGINKDNPNAPIDTKYFKDIELEILSQFENLDKSLDGWLIKSENYQALNTIKQKFSNKVNIIYIDPPFNTGSDFDYIDKYQDSTWLSLLNDRIRMSKSFLKDTGTFYLHLDYRADYLGKMLLKNIFNIDVDDTNQIIWRFGWISGQKVQGNMFMRNHQTIFRFPMPDAIFNKNHTYFIDYKTISYKENKNVFKTFLKGLNIDDADVNWDDSKISLKTKGGKIIKLDKNRKSGYEGKYPLEDVWNTGDYDILHSILIQSFTNEKTEKAKELTQKPEHLILRMIEVSTNKNDDNIVLDFFAGSGTTITTALKLKRKWIGVEMGEYFYDTIIPRLKEALARESNREPCGITKDVDWGGGGFFKYYELEQYEETLKNAKYENGDLFLQPDKDCYSQYVFMKDKKMLDALELDYKNNKVKVVLSKLYKDIDIPETLSNLLGKNIKKIEPDEVEFEDGEKINIRNLDYKMIKPLIWW